jgi:hypothetical protein
MASVGDSDGTVHMI